MRQFGQRRGEEAVWTEKGRRGSLDRWREEAGSREAGEEAVWTEGGDEAGRTEGERRQGGERGR